MLIFSGLDIESSYAPTLICELKKFYRSIDNTKINAIFVDIKAGDCSVSVHILNFELFLQITKIVTKSTQEGTEISASALFFYVAGVEISKFLSKFAPF